MRFVSTFVFLTVVPFLCFAQKRHKLSKNDSKAITQLQKDIGFIKTIKPGGSLIGIKGEIVVANYFSERYKSLQVQPFKSNSYQKVFAHPWSKRITENTMIKVGGQSLKIPSEAFPLPWSANSNLATEVMPEIMEQGNMWFLPIFASIEDAENPNYDFEKEIYKKVQQVATLGATGVLLYDEFNGKYAPSYNRFSNLKSLEIPVIFVTASPWLLATTDLASSVPIDLAIALEDFSKDGLDVVAYIDNGAAQTVILSAQYDQIGFDKQDISLQVAGNRAIHKSHYNNGSGSAALLQLAERLSSKKNKLKKYNYLFVHYAADHMELFGMADMMKSMSVESSKVAYILDLDNVGQLDDRSNALSVSGLSKSPIWASVLPLLGKEYKLVTDSTIKSVAKHTDVFKAGIPILSFSTNTSADNPQRGNDAGDINYAGELRIINTITEIIGVLNKTQ